MRRAFILVLVLAGQFLLAAPARAQDWCPAHADCGELAPSLVDTGPFAQTPHVRYALIRHTDGERPTATVAYNPGGPGTSAIQYARNLAAILGPHFDVLTFDPRGVGASGTLECGLPDDTFLRPLGFQVRAIGACGGYLGPAAGSFATAQAADDLDAIRAHLGIDKLRLYGQSYGATLMTTYARRYPSHVDAMLLSAPAMHTDPFERARAHALTRALALACERSDGACSADVALDDLRVVAQQLRPHPLSYAITDDGRRYRQQLDEAALVSVVMRASYETDQYLRLPTALHAARDGDPRELVRLAEQLPLRSVRAREPQEAVMLHLAVTCEDAALPYDPVAAPNDRLEKLRHALADVNPIGPFGSAAWSAGLQLAGLDCLAWPAHSVHRPAGPLPDVPALVVTGDLDAVAPSSAARALARQMPHAQFIELPNVGHVPESEPSRCVMAEYRLFLQLPGTLESDCLHRLPPVSLP